MIEKGNADRFELSTFYSTIDALAIELRISIYTSIVKNLYYFHKQYEFNRKIKSSTKRKFYITYKFSQIHSNYG